MTKKIDTISVITTFFNAERFLVNAVNSVNRQLIDGFKVEYILVNDKSTDNSLKYLMKYLDDNANEKIDFKVFECTTNLGCGGARKYGISKATGDYFMFLDADDYYLNADFLKRAYSKIKTSGADIVEYGIIFNQANGSAVNNVVPKEIEIKNPLMAEVAMFKDNIIKFNVWTKIYKRAIVESHPYSDEREFEDVRTIPYWVENAKKILVEPTIEINYRAASNSIIRNDEIKTRIGTITAILSLFDHFKKYPLLIKEMYKRSLIDIEGVLNNHSSKDPGYNEMAKLNREMLKYIYPSRYKEITYLEGEELQQPTQKS